MLLGTGSEISVQPITVLLLTLFLLRNQRRAEVSLENLEEFVELPPLELGASSTTDTRVVSFDVPDDFD